MVLTPLRILALVLLVGGCKQSLFDARAGHAPDGGGEIASTCPMPCLGDAGGDFMKGGKWRYLDDHRDRTWAAMTASGSTLTGADPKNKITSCASNGDAEACGALPGALLVSSSGAMAMADPAIEWKADTNRVIELQLGVYVPSGSPSQVVRLYRNSREDVLFTGSADPGTTLTKQITVDAVASDRFLVAIAPTGFGATDVGVQLFVVDTGAVFPTNCEVALAFDLATGMGVVNACGGNFNAKDVNLGAVTPSFSQPVYPELGLASAAIAMDRYYDSATALPRNGDFTVQLWIKHTMLMDMYTVAFAFSDHDLDSGGGLSIDLYDNSSNILTIEALACLSATPTFDGPSAMYPADMKWHFVRAVHQGSALELCIDGTRQAMKSVPGTLKSGYPPYIGKNVTWTPAGAYFIGSIDDVRVFSTALPCE